MDPRELAKEGARPSDPRVTVGLGLAAFGIYVFGACRTIYVGDSGELVAAAATLGIPHPSGYPLYVLLGKLWTLLVPVGSVAFRMSLFSAACAAATVALVHLVARTLGLHRAAAVLAALLVALGPSFWSQANIQRVYALNALCVMAVTLLAVRWWQSADDVPRDGTPRDIRFMVAAAFVAGLGACNHTFMGLFGLVVGVFAVLTEPQLLRRVGHLGACVGAGLLGLLPYAYLPLRSRQQPRLDWGNPETWEGFRAVVGRADFWDRKWMESAADWLPIVLDYLRGLGEELTWVGVGLALSGAVLALRRAERGRWPVLLPLLAMGVNLWALGVHGSRSDIFTWHRYYIPSYLVAALLAAIGVHLLLEKLRASNDGSNRRAAIAAAMAFVLPLILLVDGWARFDRSDYRIAEDFSRRLLASLPPGAHLAASDDNVLFVLIYLQFVEGVRPDIDLILQGVGDAELPALRFDPDDDPLFFTHHPNWNHPQIAVEPVGLAFRTVRRDAPPPELGELPDALDGELDPSVPKDYLTRNLLGHFRSMLGMSFERRDWPRARTEFERAALSAPENDVLFYNLGLIYRRNGMPRRALAAFERSVEINPRRLASDKPARAVDRVAEVRPTVEKLEALERELAADPSLEGLEPGSADHFRTLARLLAERGEPELARGRALLAAEVEAGVDARPGTTRDDDALTSPASRRIAHAGRTGGRVV